MQRMCRCRDAAVMVQRCSGVVQMCRGGAGAEVLSGGIRGGVAEFMSLGSGGFAVVV